MARPKGSKSKERIIAAVEDLIATKGGQELFVARCGAKSKSFSGNDLLSLYD